MASPFSASAGSKPGLEIWRIEKMLPVPVDPKTYGQFYSGDAYIVLKTTEKKGSYSWDIFFLLGKDCSQDEQGAAAYHTVTLDDQLGGSPVQHREVQGHESDAFVALFKDGIRYMDGGVASGFNKVERDKYDPRLFHLKGKRNVRSRQVKLGVESLNDGDVFILDLGLTIYLFNGAQANKFEKVKGIEVANRINSDERGARAKIIVLESGKDDNADFWKALGGKKPVPAAVPDDDAKEDPPTLHRVSDASGQMQITKVAEGSFERNMLDSNDVFILDASHEIFVWVGKGATKDERNKGMEYAKAFLSQSGRPDYTPVTRMGESGETAPFKSFFKQFDPPRVVSAKEPKPQIHDVSALYERAQKAEEKMADDATGKVEIWRIENLERAPVPPETYGQFYSGDSYILLYTYIVRGKPKYIIYFWQGKDSSSDEKAASALHTVKLDDSLGGQAVQVRVVQNQEPNHFLSLFKGKMVVHNGGNPSGFKNRAPSSVPVEENPNKLYHVRGTNAINTRAVQMALAAGSLNSGDCFILVTPSTLYVWQGVGSNGDERSTAASVAKVLQGGRHVVAVNEGEEPEEFWAALGGRGEYATTRAELGVRPDPRLFECTTARGFQVREVFDYSQDDLLNDEVLILDAFDEVFVWIGRDSSHKAREQALQAALDYVAKANRSADTPVWKVQAGSEPPNFTCHFLGWSEEKASDFADPYQKKLDALKKASGGAAGAPAAGAAAAPAKAPMQRVDSAASIGSQYLDPATNKFPLAQLVDRNKPIQGVDPAKREQYLSDAEFSATFKMSRDEFSKLAGWKVADLKKKVNLY